MMIGLGLGVTHTGGVFTPLKLPGLELWLDASQIVGLNDGDPVATWSDLSGNGNHATQATGSKRPLWKTAIVNGRAVVRPDGVDDYLATASASPTLAQPGTVYIVGALAAGGYLIDSVGGGRNAITDQSGLASLFAGNGPIQSSQAVGTTIRIWTATFNGATSILRVNGVQKLSGDAGSQSQNGFVICARTGGTLGFNAGDVCEYIVSSLLHSASDMQRTERYLGAKYGIAVS